MSCLQFAIATKGSKPYNYQSLSPDT